MNLKQDFPSFRTIFLLFILSSCIPNKEEPSIKLKTDYLTIGIDNQGKVIELLDNTTQKNHVSTDTSSYFISVRVDKKFRHPREVIFNDKNLNFDFGEGIKVAIGVEQKDNYINFEILSVEKNELVDLITWGPYFSTIDKVIGETVGVVRGIEFALGIQSLNVKTLGGYPWHESDRMPGFDFTTVDDPDDMKPGKARHVLYRIEAAKPTKAGSSIQAYSRNRFEDRIVSEFNHKKIVAPSYEDGGVIGSKIALFGCAVDSVLSIIADIEIRENLPHPMIDGEWGKLSRAANAAYLITDFTEENVDEAIDLTKKAGLRHLYHYGKTFENWGHFELFKGEFPNGIQSLKNCVDKAEEAGVKLGTHFLSNFITTNDPYVTPVPDNRLAKVGSSVLSEDISKTDIEIYIDSPEFFNQMKNNNLKTVRIGDELIRYGKVTEKAPWKLIDCQRGAFETVAAEHNKGDKISKLLDHGYKVFLTETDLTVEMSERIADLYNKTGLRQISFDGLEGNRSTGLGTYGETMMPLVWYNNLEDELKDHLIIDASRTTHFFWHIYTRMNWGEPWYGDFRESQTEYRFNNQAYFQRNYMPGMLGWFKLTEETSIEDTEWMLTKSAGFDAGYALVASGDVIRKNGNSDRILALIGDWEKLRLSGSFSDSQKEQMRDTEKEFSLRRIGENSWNLRELNVKVFYHKFKVKQPGEPLNSTFEYSNEGEDQRLKFTLTAVDASVGNIQFEIDNYKQIVLPITIKKGQKIRYEGGEKAIIYSSNWEKVKELKIEEKDLEIKEGPHTILFNCEFGDIGDDAKVKLELKSLSNEQVVEHKY